MSGRIGRTRSYSDHTHAGLTAHIILDGEMTLTLRRKIADVSGGGPLRCSRRRGPFGANGAAGLPLSGRRKIVNSRVRRRG